MSELREGSFARPNAIFGPGPLPTHGANLGSGNLPGVIIDSTSDLLGGFKPGSYGENPTLNSLNAYQCIPHRVQRIVPAIRLPSPDGRSFVNVCHQVTDGDLAFNVRMAYAPMDTMANTRRHFVRQNILHMCDILVNLPTANYIFHGVQSWIDNPTPDSYWKEFTMSLLPSNMREMVKEWDEAVRHSEEQKYVMRMRCVRFLVHNIVPCGVAAGSEKQGGQHQGTVYRAATAPVDLVTSLVVQGRTEKLANLWAAFEITPGDDLCIAPMRMDPGEGRATLDFQMSIQKNNDRIYTVEVNYNYIYYTPCIKSDLLCAPFTMYWRIARPEVKKRKFHTVPPCRFMASATSNGTPIQVGFSPYLCKNEIRFNDYQLTPVSSSGSSDGGKKMKYTRIDSNDMMEMAMMQAKRYIRIALRKKERGDNISEPMMQSVLDGWIAVLNRHIQSSEYTPGIYLGLNSVGEIKSILQGESMKEYLDANPRVRECLKYLNIGVNGDEENDREMNVKTLRQEPSQPQNGDIKDKQDSVDDTFAFRQVNCNNQYTKEGADATSLMEEAAKYTKTIAKLKGKKKEEKGAESGDH